MVQIKKLITRTLRRDFSKYVEDVDLFENYASDPDAPNRVNFIKQILAEY